VSTTSSALLAAASLCAWFGRQNGLVDWQKRCCSRGLEEVNMVPAVLLVLAPLVLVATKNLFAAAASVAAGSLLLHRQSRLARH